jgi:hypothetical protein
MRISKSQIAFKRKRNFAIVWIPGKYLSNGASAPLVLTLSFGERDPSLRWKEVVLAAKGHYTHHLELHDEGDLDAEVIEWLRTAWAAAA